MSIKTSKLISIIQLNKYETAPYFLQLSQNLTSDCLLISVFLPSDHKIVLFWSAEQFYDHIMQKPVKTGKNTEINQQSYVKFWLNWIRNGTVSYWFTRKWKWFYKKRQTIMKDNVLNLQKGKKEIKLQIEKKIPKSWREH